jgi:phospholipid/cholesterol/gamma-HCH transport system substrate-binding protein
MMDRNPIETIMGAVVVGVAGLFMTFAYQTADLEDVQGYDLKAAFTKVGGLQNGSDVRISGIKVGTVTNQYLDKRTFEAIVTLTLQPDIKLPNDSVASITSGGLLGGKYVKLVPGQSKAPYKAGDNIVMTEDYQSLEDLVSDVIFLATDSNSGSASPEDDL